MRAVRWSHSSILQSASASVGWPAARSSRMRPASEAWTRRRITSGRPGTRTFTSGSCAQKPKQPTEASFTSRPWRSMSEAKAWYTPSAPLPAPQVPMPTPMRGRGGNSFAMPASRTALKPPISCMRITLSSRRDASARDAAPARSCGRRWRGPLPPPGPGRTGRNTPRCAGNSGRPAW